MDEDSVFEQLALWNPHDTSPKETLPLGKERGAIYTRRETVDFILNLVVYTTIFMNGKQKRAKRPATVDGMDVDDFIRNNADPIWLHQNQMWEYMDLSEEDDLPSPHLGPKKS